MYEDEQIAGVVDPCPLSDFSSISRVSGVDTPRYLGLIDAATGLQGHDLTQNKSAQYFNSRCQI